MTQDEYTAKGTKVMLGDKLVVDFNGHPGDPYKKAIEHAAWHNRQRQNKYEAEDSTLP